MGKQSISIYKANVINLQIPLNKSTLGRLLFFKCNRQGRDGGWGGGGGGYILSYLYFERSWDRLQPL